MSDPFRFVQKGLEPIIERQRKHPQERGYLRLVDPIVLILKEKKKIFILKGDLAKVVKRLFEFFSILLLFHQ